MVAHTDRVGAAEDDQLPTIVKISLPAVKARIKPGPTSAAGPVIEMQLSGFAAQHTLQTRDLRAHVDDNATLDHLRIYLCSRSSETQLRAPASDTLPGSLVAQLLCDSLSIAFDTRQHHQCLVVRCAQLSSSLVTPAVKEIGPILQLWKTASDNLPKASPPSDPAALLLYSVIRSAVEEKQTFKQPSFAHESSYGLHHEDQRNIRRDLGWSILTRVRHWMKITRPATSVAHDDIADYTIGALLTIDEFATGTDMFIRQQPCIQIAFGEAIHPADSHAPIPDSDWQIFAKVDVLRLVHEGTSISKSSVQRSVVTLFSPSTGTRYRTYLKGDQRTNQLRSVNTIKIIQVELRDSVLPAMNAVLDLMSDAPRQAAVPDVAKTNRQLWSITVDNHVGECNIHLIGGGLRLSGSLGNSYGNIVIKTASADPEADTAHYAYRNALVGLQGVTINLLAEAPSQSLLSLPADHSIASTTVNDIKLVLSHRHVPKKLAELQRGMAVSLGHFAFTVHPQVKSLGNFLVHWKKEHFM